MKFRFIDTICVCDSVLARGFGTKKKLKHLVIFQRCFVVTTSHFVYIKISVDNNQPYQYRCCSTISNFIVGIHRQRLQLTTVQSLVKVDFKALERASENNIVRDSTACSYNSFTNMRAVAMHDFGVERHWGGWVPRVR